MTRNFLYFGPPQFYQGWILSRSGVEPLTRPCRTLAPRIPRGVIPHASRSRNDKITSRAGQTQRTPRPFLRVEVNRLRCSWIAEIQTGKEGNNFRRFPIPTRSFAGSTHRSPETCDALCLSNVRSPRPRPARIHWYIHNALADGCLDFKAETHAQFLVVYSANHLLHLAAPHDWFFRPTANLQG